MTTRSHMSLHDDRGARKYLNSAERRRFIAATRQLPREARLFCLVLVWSGARISEVLALTPVAFDLDRGVVAIATLKRRRAGVVREVPLPPTLMRDLKRAFRLAERQWSAEDAGRRLWPWCRQTGWRLIKAAMTAAAVSGACAMPKGLRHGFAVAAFQALIPPHLVQRWLGHASLKTTSIYGDVAGSEELAFAARLWR
jgi:integrase/recombinase XerD